MNILVCVKYVPDATADRTFEGDNTVDRVGVDGLLSELDEYAVEQALQLKVLATSCAAPPLTYPRAPPEHPQLATSWRADPPHWRDTYLPLVLGRPSPVVRGPLPRDP